MRELNIIDRARFKEKPTKFNNTDYTNYYLREKIHRSLRDKQIFNQNNHENKVDNFCMHRKFNFPELIFNQDPTLDSYFEINQNEKWTHQTDNESTNCYICHKQCYVMIFYERYDT